MSAQPTRTRRQASRLVALTGVLGLVLSSLLLLATTTPAQAAGPQTFNGSNYGAIPDGGNTCPQPGAARDVTFAVTGVPQRQLADVRVTGLAIAHTFVGDVTATLIAPNGALVSLFGRTGATTAGAFGDNSNLVGPYAFADTDTPDPGGWWAAATAAVDTNATVASGTYRASQVGGAGATGATVDLTAAFAGVANPNGTWTLRFTDGCSADTGSVTAATLSLTPIAPDCSAQQAAVTTAQNNVTAAQTAQSSAAADKIAADAKVAAAQANVTAPQAKVAAAQAKVTKAKAKVKAKKKALKAAKAGGDPAKIAKAKKKLAKAKAKLKAAKAALKTANAELASANAALASAKAEQSAAAAAVTAADADKAAADAALSAAQTALADCQANKQADKQG